MAIKIRIDNLACDITEDALKDVFSQVGAVESVKIRSDSIAFLTTKCSGYVEMTLEVDTYRAVRCLNGATFHNRKIHLIEDRPLYERAREVMLSQMQTLAQHAEDLKRQYSRWSQ
jgi:RNA recognition motif-containing protein